MFELPPIIAPPPVLTRRNYFGWIALAAIFGALISLQFFSYLSRDSFSESRIKVSDLDGQLKRVIAAQSAANQFGVKNSTADMRKTIGDTAESAGKYRTTNVGASELFVIAKYEAGEQPTADDVAQIKRTLQAQTSINAPKSVSSVTRQLSKEDARKRVDTANAISEIYGSKSLTPDRARSLANSLPDDAFMFRLAKVHALSKAGLPSGRDKLVSPSEGFKIIGATAVGVLALGVGAILWAIYFIVRVNGGLRPLGHPAGELPSYQADRFALRAAQYMGLYAAISVGISFMALVFPVNEYFAEAVVGALLIAMVPLLAKSKIDGQIIPVSAQGWSTENLGRNIAWGIGGAIANAPVILIVAFASSFIFRGLPEAIHPVALELRNQPSLWTILMLVGVASVAAPIFEETCFRGTLLPAASNLFRSPVIAVIVTSIIFGALHPTGIPAILPLASIGAMGAMLTYQTRSLVPAVTMHAVNNLAVLLITLAIS